MVEVVVVVVAVDVIVVVIGILVGIIKPYILECCKKSLENINITLLQRDIKGNFQNRIILTYEIQ